MDLQNVAFSSVFSDHMFTAECQDGKWSAGLIQPYGPIPLPPSVSTLHYGISVFEGLKAHKAPDGTPLLFRARDNALPMRRSAARLAMPSVPEELFLEGLRKHRVSANRVSPRTCADLSGAQLRFYDLVELIVR